MRCVVRQLTCAFVLWSAVSLPLHAQGPTGTIQGEVTGPDGTGLSGVQVSLVETSHGTITNASGEYLIPGVPPGTYTLRVQGIGYGTEEAAVTVAGGESVEQDFGLVEEAIALREVTVTVGSRAAHSAADELAVPVDVFPRVELEATQSVELADVLAELAPSVHFPRQQIADLTSGVRPFQLRGLSPDHALVLINGKRRHSAAVVHVFGSTTSGSSGVDINAIPAKALGRMEVLRDGAAAQYGSDAIAGVVNLVLRDDVHSPEIELSLGQYFPDSWPNDGRRFDVSANWGIALGDRGTLNLTAAYSDRQPTQRAGPDPRDQLCVGDPELSGDCDGDEVADIDGDGVNEVVEKRNDVPQPSHLWGDGESQNYLLFWNGRLAVGESGTEFYNFGGASYRQDLHSGYFRRALDERNWPEIYPQGFLPSFDGDTRDIAMTTGLRGTWGEWTWDVSGQFGQNRLDNTIFNSHNASLGPCLEPAPPCAPGEDGELGTEDDPGMANKTEFYAGSLELNQYVAGIDLSRLVDVGLAAPINAAIGALFRADNYKVIAGEPASYIDGHHPNRNGGRAAVGAQVFSGYRPAQAADAWRTNVGAYLELEGEVADQLLLSAAARAENYSDFGATVTGKIAARFQPHERVILRGAASTGFRAPSLSQTYYAHTSTGFRTDTITGERVGYELGEFPVGSPEALALGAEPLREETSRNLSAGLAITPLDGWNITADVYRIDIEDQIILSGSLFGPTVEALLADYNAEAVKFMTNSIDARTTGVDLTTRYTYLFSDDVLLETSMSYNYNQPRVLDVHVPDVIAELKDQVFDQGNQTFYEKGRPRDRIIATARFTHGDLRAMVGARYYGSVTSLVDDELGLLHEYGGKTLTDAEVSYRLFDGLELTIGGENLFDVFPDPNPQENNIWFNGIFPYSTTSGFGFNGRYIYTRLRATL